jgi:hypothetical protein
VSGTELSLRINFAQIEEVQSSAGARDDGGPLRRVAVAAVVSNPYAGRGFVEDLSGLVGVRRGRHHAR